VLGAVARQSCLWVSEDELLWVDELTKTQKAKRRQSGVWTKDWLHPSAVQCSALVMGSSTDAAVVAVKSLEDSSLPVNFHGNLASANNDEELLHLLQKAKNSKRPAIVNYGAPWCQACRQMLPTFCNLSNDHASTLFIYADVDKCAGTTQDVRYTPTFRFYQDGNKVDEFYGAGPQRLRDRVWLHSWLGLQSTSLLSTFAANFNTKIGNNSSWMHAIRSQSPLQSLLEFMDYWI